MPTDTVTSYKELRVRIEIADSSLASPAEIAQRIDPNNLELLADLIERVLSETYAAIRQHDVRNFVYEPVHVAE